MGLIYLPKLVPHRGLAKHDLRHLVLQPCPDAMRCAAACVAAHGYFAESEFHGDAPKADFDRAMQLPCRPGLGRNGRRTEPSDRPLRRDRAAPAAQMRACGGRKGWNRDNCRFLLPRQMQPAFIETAFRSSSHFRSGNWLGAEVFCCSLRAMSRMPDSRSPAPG
jgi:hypothetical protein